MIPYSRPKRSDLYTLSQSKLLENHTLNSGTYLYSPYMAVPPPRESKQLWVFLTGVLAGKSLGWQQWQDSQHVGIGKYFSIIMPETAKLVKRMSTKKRAALNGKRFSPRKFRNNSKKYCIYYLEILYWVIYVKDLRFFTLSVTTWF